MSAESPCLLRRLDQNFEKPLLVAGMLLMIFIISYQTIYRYSANPSNNVTKMQKNILKVIISL